MTLVPRWPSPEAVHPPPWRVGSRWRRGRHRRPGGQIERHGFHGHIIAEPTRAYRIPCTSLRNDSQRVHRDVAADARPQYRTCRSQCLLGGISTTLGTDSPLIGASAAEVGGRSGCPCACPCACAPRAYWGRMMRMTARKFWALGAHPCEEAQQAPTLVAQSPHTSLRRASDKPIPGQQ